MNTPTEITQSYPFIIHKGCVYQYKGEVPEGATVLNAPNIDTIMGYVSEEYLNKMLSEKDKEIEKLMSNKKQTAVEWLVEELISMGYLHSKEYGQSPNVDAIIRRAKELEYEQLHASYTQGCIDTEQEYEQQ